jgi:hypothetical protein
MKNTILFLPKDVLSHILVDYAYPEDVNKFFKAYKELQPQYKEEVWRAKLKQYFLNRDTLFSSPLKENETYQSRFFVQFKLEKKSFYVKTARGNLLHHIFVAVHYGDWNERFSLSSIQGKEDKTCISVAKLYKKILSRAVFKAAPSSNIAWIDSMKNQRILDKCFSFLYDNMDYRKALKTVHDNCEDADLFVLYNQITRIKELIIQKIQVNEQLDLAKKIIIFSLKNPNEMQLQLVNKFIKDDPLLNNLSDEVTPTLFQLQLGDFLEFESKDYFESAYSPLINALEKKQEETALLLVKLISFNDTPAFKQKPLYMDTLTFWDIPAFKDIHSLKDIPIDSFKEFLFVKAVESKMQTVIDAIFNKFPLKDPIQMYDSLFKIVTFNSSFMDCFLDKIEYILGSHRELELKVYTQLVRKAFENRSKPQLFRKYAYAIRNFYSHFEKKPLPDKLLKREVIDEEQSKKLNIYIYTLYQSALSIQDMAFFEMVRKTNPLNMDNVGHKQIIRLLIIEVPLLAGQIDAIKITNQNTQSQYYQPYIWTLGNQQVDTIDRYTLTYDQTVSILHVKPGDTLTYQKMINILLTDYHLQLEELMHSKNESGKTIHNTWVQFLKIHCHCIIHEITNQNVQESNKKQKLK